MPLLHVFDVRVQFTFKPLSLLDYYLLMVVLFLVDYSDHLALLDNLLLRKLLQSLRLHLTPLFRFLTQFFNGGEVFVFELLRLLTSLCLDQILLLLELFLLLHCEDFVFIDQIHFVIELLYHALHVLLALQLHLVKVERGGRPLAVGWRDLKAFCFN